MTKPTVDVAVADLSGVLLDYFVAVEEGHEPFLEDDGVYVFKGNDDDRMYAFRPSMDWDCAGPIIDRLRPAFCVHANGKIEAVLDRPTGGDDYIEMSMLGKDYPEAFCRVFVLSRLGDTVTLPAELAHLWEEKTMNEKEIECPKCGESEDLYTPRTHGCYACSHEWDEPHPDTARLDWLIQNRGVYPQPLEFDSGEWVTGWHPIDRAAIDEAMQRMEGEP